LAEHNTLPVVYNGPAFVPRGTTKNHSGNQFYTHMTETNEVTPTTTKVVGYFNPHDRFVSIQISELNIKATLAPKKFIRDRQGNMLNDPIFEKYVHPGGLSRSVGKIDLPIRRVPQQIKPQPERPANAVTQAKSFVRQPDGSVTPVYANPPVSTTTSERTMNRPSHIGFSNIEDARKAGLIGKPRLVPEDYGVDESKGMPSLKDLPPVKCSIESPPKIKSSGMLPSEMLAQVDETMTPQEKSRRQQLVQNMNRASSAPTDTFNPNTIPVPIQPPTPPPTHQTTPAPPALPPAPPQPPQAPITIQPAPTAPVAAPPLKRKRGRPRKNKIATVLERPVEPPQTETTPETEIMPDDSGSGVIEPIFEAEGEEESPVPDSPPADATTRRRFVCGADGRAFEHRSGLERHVRANFPKMFEALMASYPPEG
jgi:hypothetical protein